MTGKFLPCSVFAEWGSQIMRCEYRESTTFLRRYTSHFGLSPENTALLWYKVHPNLPKHSLPKHILFALLFLKLYDSTEVLASMCQVDEKTFRKWLWPVVNSISNLNLVRIILFELLIY